MLARIVHCTTWAMTCTLSNESWQMHNSTKLVTVLSWAWFSFLFHGWKFPFSKMLGTDQEPSCCLKHQQETTVNIDLRMHDTKLVFFSIVNTWKKSFYWHHVDGYFQILPCRKKLLKINHKHWTTFTDICLHWLLLLGEVYLSSEIVQTDLSSASCKQKGDRAWMGNKVITQPSKWSKKEHWTLVPVYKRKKPWF